MFALEVHWKFLITLLLFLECLLALSLVIPKQNYIQNDDMLIKSTFIDYYVRNHGDGINDKAENYPILWPNGLVYYEISPYLNRHRSLILKAMKHISNKIPCIGFSQRFNDENYVYITEAESDSCSSYIGMAGGRQELYLGQSCLNMGTILHELMHVLGFFHEHNRPDRDEYLKIHYENIIKGKENNFIKLTRKEFYMITEFDYNSIMIYGQDAFSKNSMPTMVPTKNLYNIRDPHTKNSLSNGDILAAFLNYCD